MRTSLIIIVFVNALGVSLCASGAAAQRVYRCNGMIQFYPCGQDLFKKRPAPLTSRREVSSRSDIRARAALGGDTPGAYAEVVKKSYQRAGSQGWWRGTVKGNGQVHLQLQILRNGLVESTRYMGNVLLKDKATWFSFKSPLPAGSGWSWDIRAFAS
ncbi:MAG: hypothetical protein RL417_148 [Pseudomonadota bacterium]